LDACIAIYCIALNDQNGLLIWKAECRVLELFIHIPLSTEMAIAGVPRGEPDGRHPKPGAQTKKS
jgi:hypothetical protein